MAAIANAFVQVTTNQSRTGNAGVYADISGAEIASSEFVAGQKYLLLVRASVNQSSTSQGGRVRVAHGSTAFADSEYAFEMANVASTFRISYFWFHVWTAVSSEKIVLQFASDGAGTVNADQIMLFAMRLDADLTENTDWFFNEDTGDDDLSATFLDGASVTFTPSQANQRWLCMVMAQHEPVGVAQQHESRMDLSGGTSFTGGLNSVEPEDATNDIMFFSYLRAFSLPASSHTLKEQSREETEAGGSRLHSKAFALNLDKFKDVTQEFTAGPTAYSTSSFASAVEALSHTKTAPNGDVLILACNIDNYDAAVDFAHHRIQVDNSDQPDTQTSDDYDYVATNNDSTDQSAWHMLTREAITGNIAVDHDGYASNAGVDFVDSALIVFSMELAAGGNVTLVADAGSFALTGIAAGLRASRKLPADAGAFSLTGIAANLVAARKVVADAGAFSLGGQAAQLLAARRLPADAGAFTLSGQDATLTKGRTLVADGGVFALTGVDAGLRAARRLTADVGVFVLTGNPATLVKGRTLTAEVGVFTLAGQAAQLRATRRITAEVGVFTLAGTDARLLRGLRLVADPGAFVLTGNAAQLRALRRLLAGAGSFVLVGQDASLFVGFPPAEFPGWISGRVVLVATVLGRVDVVADVRGRIATTPTVVGRPVTNQN